MSGNTPDLDLTLEVIKESLTAKLPHRYVRRSLPQDPMNLPRKEAEAGVICIVNEGGGQFANYVGREGDLGTLGVAIAGFLQVPEKSDPVEIERAELAMVKELLDWTNDQGEIRAGDSVLPIEFAQSKQLEHPYGWIVLKLEVRP